MFRYAHSAADTKVPIHTLLVVISIELDTKHVDVHEASENKETKPVVFFYLLLLRPWQSSTRRSLTSISVS